MKKISRQFHKFYRHVIAPHFCALPNFIIIGTMKGGTSSLYSYLVERPDVHPAATKEIHYFDNYYSKGLKWYKSQFPQKNKMHSGQITGESSPYYLAHPCVPGRIRKALPQVKLVVLLRNPVDRAYSHYQHNCRLKREPLTFEKALDAEEGRIAGEAQKMLNDPKYCSYNHPVFSYKTRGNYEEQLQRWFTYFPCEQFLIIKSEDFFDYPKQMTNQVSEFLELPPYEDIEYKKYNYFGQYSDMSEDIRNQLVDYFKPYNQRLYTLLGVDFNWQ
jgi:hypothetical protein